MTLDWNATSQGWNTRQNGLYYFIEPRGPHLWAVIVCDSRDKMSDVIDDRKVVFDKDALATNYRDLFLSYTQSRMKDSKCQTSPPTP